MNDTAPVTVAFGPISERQGEAITYDASGWGSDNLRRPDQQAVQLPTSTDVRRNPASDSPKLKYIIRVAPAVMTPSVTRINSAKPRSSPGVERARSGWHREQPAALRLELDAHLIAQPFPPDVAQQTFDGCSADTVSICSAISWTTTLTSDSLVQLESTRGIQSVTRPATGRSPASLAAWPGRSWLRARGGFVG